MILSFGEENVNNFLVKVMAGSTPFTSLPKQGFKIKKSSRWDGKDAPPLIEENYDDL